MLNIARCKTLAKRPIIMIIDFLKNSTILSFQRSALSSYDQYSEDAVGRGPLMAKKTLKKICDFYDWDVEVVRIILSALKFVSKWLLWLNKTCCKQTLRLLMYRVLGTNNQRGTFSFEIIDIVRSST